MPDNDIRTEAAELLGEGEYTELIARSDRAHPAWADLPDGARRMWRDSVGRHVDRMIAAGWRPPTPPAGYVIACREPDGELLADGHVLLTAAEAWTAQQHMAAAMPDAGWTVYAITQEADRG